MASSSLGILEENVRSSMGFAVLAASWFWLHAALDFGFGLTGFASVFPNFYNSEY